MKKVTIMDVANKAGVSKKTVSRVINNEANISPQMLEKVQKAIDELGFKRNPLGRALAQNRSFFIALLSDNPSLGYLMSLQRGMLKSCTEENMGLFLYECSYKSPSLVGDIEEFVNKTLVDGLILTPPLCDNQDLLSYLDKAQVPYMRIGPNDQSSGEYIGYDAQKAAADMTQYLIEQGHKEIAFIKGNPDQKSSELSQQGFQTAMQKAGLSESATLLQGFYTFESGKDAASKLLALDTLPSAVFAANDEMAAGVLHQLQQNGVQIPRDISVCGIDNISLASKVWPRLTTMDHPLEEIGYEAAKRLILRLQNKSDNLPAKGLDQGQIVDCELIVRESTASRQV